MLAIDATILAAVGHIYATYARAIDEKRYDLLAYVFAADAALEYRVGPHHFSCSGDQAAKYFAEFLVHCYCTNHLIAAPTVELNGEAVKSSARVVATHLQRRENGESNRWTVRGSYHDRLVRIGDGWLICERLCLCPDSEGEFLSCGVEQYPEVAWIEPARIA